MQRRMRLGRRYYVSELYDLVEQWTSLDDEDFDPVPGTSMPKWKRNVRGVLKDHTKGTWLLRHSYNVYERVG